MNTYNVLMAVLFTMGLLSAMLVSARPHSEAPSDDLVDAASDLTHALERIVETLRTGRVTGRRRRMVQFDVGRYHHSPSYYTTNSRRRNRDYRNQRGGGRISDISDH